MLNGVVEAYSCGLYFSIRLRGIGGSYLLAPVSISGVPKKYHWNNKVRGESPPIGNQGLGVGFISDIGVIDKLYVGKHT